MKVTKENCAGFVKGNRFCSTTTGPSKGFCGARHRDISLWSEWANPRRHRKSQGNAGDSVLNCEFCALLLPLMADDSVDACLSLKLSCDMIW